MSEWIEPPAWGHSGVRHCARNASQQWRGVCPWDRRAPAKRGRGAHRGVGASRDIETGLKFGDGGHKLPGSEAFTEPGPNALSRPCRRLKTPKAFAQAQVCGKASTLPKAWTWFKGSTWFESQGFDNLDISYPSLDQRQCAHHHQT